MNSYAFRARRGAFAFKLIVSLAMACFALGAVSVAAQASGPITITSGPADGGATNQSTTSFGLSYVTGGGKEVEFYCSMDNQFTFAPCQNVQFPNCNLSVGVKTCTQTSRQYITSVQRTYVFRTFASECDSPCNPGTEGDIGPITTRTFTVDRVAPTLTLVSGPSLKKPVLKGKPTFTFTASEPVSLRCAKNGSASTFVCTSPVVLNGVRNGRNSLTVTATDSAGNASVPLAVEYRVDVFKPKKCRKGKSKRAKAKYAKCKKANAKAKAQWKKRNR